MNALVVARRDFASYVMGWYGTLITAGILFVQGLLFQAWVLGREESRYSHEVLEDFFYLHGGFVMVAAVLLTMRSFAEERTDGTYVLLQTSTIRDGSIVAGKWLAAMAMLTVLTVISVYMPLLIFVHGKVSVAHLVVGYAGSLGLASVTASIGIFGSSLFRSQLVAGIFSGILVVAFLTTWMLSEVLEPPFAGMAAYMALFQQHFIPFYEGRVELGGVVYYVSLTWLFLLLTTRVLASRRWE